MDQVERMWEEISMSRQEQGPRPPRLVWEETQDAGETRVMGILGRAEGKEVWVVMEVLLIKAFLYSASRTHLLRQMGSL